MRQTVAQRRFTLMAISVVTLTIWLIVLPWIAEQPGMKQHLSELDRQGIDGGAMFYTELEVMDRILHRLEH